MARRDLAWRWRRSGQAPRLPLRVPMTTDDAGSDTLGASTLADDGPIDQLATERVPVLTIALHPDRARVGERSWLNDPGGRGAVRLSRLYPAFGPPAGPDAVPLRDRHLSRQPHRLQFSADGGVTIEVAQDGSPLVVDRDEVSTNLHFDAAALDTGVVLELGQRVVLLLHRVSPIPDGSPAQDLGLLGVSDAIARVRQRVVRVAAHEVPVLVRGETGTGKELAALAVHACSARREAAFVSVNMAALVSSTAPSELFGHAKGSFTGATSDSTGFFGAADGGTLFLDEIGDTAPEVQASLLRALESGEVQPLGGGAPTRRDVRLIAATDNPLESAVQQGGFRLPLLQRLSTYTIELPPLRARREDIGPLLLYFLQTILAEVGREALLDGPWLPTAVVRHALLASWPGNVRELRNYAQQLVIDHADGSRIPASTRPPGAPTALSPWSPARATAVATGEPPRSARKDLRDIDEASLLAAMRAHDYQPGPAAKALGISRSSVYALIETSQQLRTAGELEATEIEQALSASGGDPTLAARTLEVSKRGLLLRVKQLGLEAD
jgi:two-component system, NtrC family, nitrogen regulation response regulator GlnG